MTYYSQFGQDKTVLEHYNFKKNGYFVEIGAWDGIKISNTYAMEKLGWNGICVEPLPDRYAQLVRNRKCKTYNLAVDFESNKVLDFVVNNFLSGDIERLDIARVEAEPGGLQKRIKVKTINFTEMLDDAQAPQFMEFLSLDTEGSEYDILNGLDHSKYRFGYISVEHNYKEPTRTKIKELLVSKGYTYKGPNKVDDDYINDV
jgi:FkbM family methyltransferase